MAVLSDNLGKYLEKCRKSKDNLRLEEQSILQVINDVKRIVEREDPKFVSDLFCRESVRGKRHEGNQIVLDLSIKSLKVSNSACMSSKTDSQGMYV